MRTLKTKTNFSKLIKQRKNMFRILKNKLILLKMALKIK